MIKIEIEIHSRSNKFYKRLNEAIRTALEEQLAETDLIHSYDSSFNPHL